MNTGIESYAELEPISSLFPFPGSEIALVAITVLAWIWFHIWQVRNENREYRHALASLSVSEQAEPEAPRQEKPRELVTAEQP